MDQARLGNSGFYFLISEVIFFSFFLTPQIQKLLTGIPYSLILSNDNRELFVLVPNVRPVRPPVGSAPFTTDIVLDRLGRKGVEWMKNAKVCELIIE